MAKIFDKCKKSVDRALDHSFINNIDNIVLLIVAALLLISLLTNPTVLIAIALLGLFLWAILYC